MGLRKSKRMPLTRRQKPIFRRKLRLLRIEGKMPRGKSKRARKKRMQSIAIAYNIARR